MVRTLSLTGLIELYQSGKSLKVVAVSAGISRQSLTALFLEAGIELRSRGQMQRVFSDEDEDFYLRCNCKGLTITNLAALAQCTRETMSKALVRARKRKSYGQAAKSAS